MRATSWCGNEPRLIAGGAKVRIFAFATLILAAPALVLAFAWLDRRGK
jgi:hypothetical protein